MLTIKWADRQVSGRSLEPMGRRRFLCGFVCGHVIRYMCHHHVCVSWLYRVSHGGPLPLVTNHPFFTSLGLPVLPVSSAFCFLYLQCFLLADHFSHLSYSPGSRKNQAKCIKEAGHSVCMLLIKKKRAPFINDSYHVLSLWRRLCREGRQL